jgi:FkbM family methyltransferase
VNSQHGQDAFVIEVLGGLENGFFLDSGASDGIRVNNTLVLEQHFGWRGICVEPNRQFFSSLIANRTAVCVNCCLYHRSGEVEFLEAGTLGGIVSEYDPGLLEFVRAVGQAPTAADGTLLTTRVAALRLAELLPAFAAPETIDYWSLDTEGSEMAILKSFPFAKYSFRVLTVEHNCLPVREDIHRFLGSKGYRRVRELQIDDAYVREDVEVPAARHWRSPALRRGRARGW